jgi:uncharacterized protein with HEPN domain
MSLDNARDAATLADLATACSRVMEYVRHANRSDVYRNHEMLSACCYQIAIIGEAVKRLSVAIRSKYPQAPWKDIAGMRDRLIHGYDSVDADELWKRLRRTCPRS